MLHQLTLPFPMSPCGPRQLCCPGLVGPGWQHLLLLCCGECRAPSPCGGQRQPRPPPLCPELPARGTSHVPGLGIALTPADGAECQGGVCSPDGLRWTWVAPVPQRGWGSQQLLREENCQTEWQGDIQETNYCSLAQEGQKMSNWCPGHKCKEGPGGKRSPLSEKLDIKLRCKGAEVVLCRV